MSCVVGLIKDGKIYMASEGAATTAEGERRPIITRKVMWNGDYLMGYTGGVRTGQLVVDPLLFTPPKEIHLLPGAIREHLESHGSIMVDEASTQIHNCNFLVGYNGLLYEILVDFQLNEVAGDFTAIGSGSPYAMGAMFATKRVKDPIKRVEIALQAACQYDSSCAPPFTFEYVE